jgi:hypothetical protein
VDTPHGHDLNRYTPLGIRHRVDHVRSIISPGHKLEPGPKKEMCVDTVTRNTSAMTLTVWPATLRLDQAAAYSGLSVDTFKLVCPVKPIEFTQWSKGHRYLRIRLDEWLSSIDPNVQTTPVGRRRLGERAGG